MDVLHSNFVLFVFLLFYHFQIAMCSYTHPHNKFRSTSTLDPIDNNYAIANYDFKSPIYEAEDEGEEDCEVPGELSRMLMQEERVIQPQEEAVEVVNMGIKEDKKEVKIGANLEDNVKNRLI